MKKIIFVCLIMSIVFSTKAQYIPSSTLQLTSPLTHEGNLRIGSAWDATSRARCVLNFGDGDYVKIGEFEYDDQLSFKASRFIFNSTQPTVFNNTGSSAAIQIPYSKSIIFGPSSVNEGTARLNIQNSSVHAYFDYKDNLNFRADKNWISSLILFGNGSVGVGFSTTYNAGDYKNMGYKLAVNGGIICEEVKVIADVPDADYVFEDDYDLKSLHTVESFIKNNKHLPNIPSAEEFKTNGYKIGEMDEILLRKVEELTLYMIELNKKVEVLEKENKELRNK